MCAKCNNWQKKSGANVLKMTARTTKQEILDLGFRYLAQSDPKAPKAMGELSKVELNEIPKTPKTYQGPRPEDFTEEAPF